MCAKDAAAWGRRGPRTRASLRRFLCDNTKRRHVVQHVIPTLACQIVIPHDEMPPTIMGIVCDLMRMILASRAVARSEEHTSELQSLMRISYAVFCLKKKKKKITNNQNINNN